MDIYAFYVSSLSSFIIACVFFTCLSPSFPDTKRKSWIITLLSSTITSLGSLPFISDFLLSNGHLQAIKHHTTLSNSICGAFQGLLLADLAVGMRAYPDRLSPTSGWAHHIAYSLMLPYVAQRGWAHIFCACLAMEIPTCAIALSFLYPRARHDVLCAALFFALRIVLHVSLLAAALAPTQKAAALDGSWLPATLLVLALAMHVNWFQSNVRGIIKRRKAASKPATIEEVKAASIQRLRAFTAQSRLQTMLAMRKLAVKCREARKRVALHRTARRALVTAFPVMLADVSHGLE